MSDKKQSNLIQGLEDHFNNTPPEQLAKEFDELEKWNQIGPDALDYFKNLTQRNAMTMTREEIEQLYVEEPNCFETDREEQWYKVGLKEGLAAADQCPALTPAAATLKALQEIQSDGVQAMKAAIMQPRKEE